MNISGLFEYIMVYYNIAFYARSQKNKKSLEEKAMAHEQTDATTGTSILAPPKNRNPQKAWSDIWELANNIYMNRGNVGFQLSNKLMVQLTAIPHKSLFINNDMTDTISTVLSEETLQNYVHILQLAYTPIYIKIQNQKECAITQEEWDTFARVLDLTEP